MAQSYFRIFYHFVWCTWDREPLLVESIERETYALIHTLCDQMNVTVFALNGIADHVHLLVTLPRTLCIADFMQAIKGGSSKALNDHHGSATWSFKWQGGYSVHTVSASHVKLVHHCIENQKEHHTAGNLWPSSEPPSISATNPSAREGGDLHF